MVAPRVRNAVISTVVILGVNIGFLVGGTIVIEKVFALPGIGALMIDSDLQPRLRRRAGDHPLLRPARDPRLPCDRPDRTRPSTRV